MNSLVLTEVLLWALGTLFIRLSSGALIHLFETTLRTIGVYIASLMTTFVLVPALCLLFGISRAAWFEAAALIALPTLLLDAFTCLLFTRVFPKLPARLAHKFGGWMMLCCAGGFVGVLVLR